MNFGERMLLLFNIPKPKVFSFSNLSQQYGNVNLNEKIFDEVNKTFFEQAGLFAEDHI